MLKHFYDSVHKVIAFRPYHLVSFMECAHNIWMIPFPLQSLELSFSLSTGGSALILEDLFCLPPSSVSTQRLILKEKSWGDGSITAYTYYDVLCIVETSRKGHSYSCLKLSTVGTPQASENRVVHKNSCMFEFTRPLSAH